MEKRAGIGAEKKPPEQVESAQQPVAGAGAKTRRKLVENSRRDRSSQRPAVGTRVLGEAEALRV